jgi:hypothetical protein
MRFNKKKEEQNPKFSKQERKKLDLLQNYSDKDIKEMLAFIAQTNKKEINETI